MFRIVTSQLPAPTFWLCCDSRDCSQQATGPIPVAFPVETQEAAAALNQIQAQFFGAAAGLGWLLGWDGQFCPEHGRQMKQQVADTRRLVEVASVLPSVVGNGGRKQ